MVRVSMLETVSEDVEGIFVWDESDARVLAESPAEVVVCAETVTTPIEANETAVASVAWMMMVLATVVFPSCTLTSTAVADAVISGARGATTEAFLGASRARPFLADPS